MKQTQAKSRAFTLIEILIVVAVLLVLGLVVVPSLMQARARAKRINCTGNLKMLGLASKVWAIDHGDRFPQEVPLAEGGAMEAVSAGDLAFVYQVMSNELSTPFVLTCPSDSERRRSEKFTTLQSSNLSYFIGLEASSTNYQCFLSGDRNIANSAGLQNRILYASTNDPVGWSQSMHVGNGNIGLSDGSVQQFSTVRLREAIACTGFQTNRLLMP